MWFNQGGWGGAKSSIEQGSKNGASTRGSALPATSRSQQRPQGLLGTNTDTERRPVPSAGPRAGPASWVQRAPGTRPGGSPALGTGPPPPFLQRAEAGPGIHGGSRWVQPRQDRQATSKSALEWLLPSSLRGWARGGVFPSEAINTRIQSPSPTRQRAQPPPAAPALHRPAGLQAGGSGAPGTCPGHGAVLLLPATGGSHRQDPAQPRPGVAAAGASPRARSLAARPGSCA